MRKPLANAAGWLLPVVVALIATPWLLHELGAARFGVWAMCVLVASLLPTLDFGYGVAAIRDMAREADPAARRRVASELLTIGLLTGALFAAVVALGRGGIARWLNFDAAVPTDEGREVLLLLAPWVALGCVNAALAAPARALERFGALAAIGITSSVALWGISIAFAVGGMKLSALMLVGIVVQAAVAVALSLLYRKTAGSWPAPARRLHTLLRSSRFAGASFANSVTSLATYHADKALVSAFIGPAAAGLYTIVANVANKLLGLIASLAGVIYPRVAGHEGRGDIAATAALYAVASRIALNVTLALATLGVVLADRFLRLWLGSVVTSELVTAFRLLIVAYVIASSAVVASNVLSGRGNARRGAWFAALGGAITLCAGLLLIPRWGLVGAGLAALLGMSQAAAFDLWVRRELIASHPGLKAWRRPWHGWAVAVVVCGMTTWGVAHGLDGWPGLLLAAVCGSAAWAAVWFGLGFAMPEERAMVDRLRRALLPMRGGL